MSTIARSALIATVLVTGGVVAIAAIAATGRIGAQGEQLVALQDGGTLHIYTDGSMAEENEYGRPIIVPPGEMLLEKNGSTIVMNGDAVARLSLEQRQQNRKQKTPQS